MSRPDALEARLRCLDLRFRLPSPDAHVDDERLAAIATGTPPSPFEAEHLAACDECVDVLVAAGEGLESLSGEPALTGAPPSAPAGEAASTERMIPSPAPAPAPAAPGRAQGRLRFGVVIGGLAVACAAAAAIGTGFLSAPEAGSADGRAADRSPVASAGPSSSPPPLRASAAPPSPSTEPPSPLPEPRSPSPEPPSPSPEPPSPRLPASKSARGGAVSPGPSSAPVPGAVAAVMGEIGERDAAAFGRAPVNAPGRGFGFLRLSATPPAQVFIGDRAYGWTPLFDLRLPEGPHDVRLVYAHPDARAPEERFRVVIPPEAHWVVKRRNLREAPPP